ncbi:DUF5134 domain-containing protein [Streptomyces sp. BI20]|uniref:DUF5134 domain-containing protein n=1 Tax=Streptomyces sp. BI20 TaxID=3403460 RepID=UPI003C709884
MHAFTTPAPLAWLLVALCAVSGLFCLARVRGADRRARETGVAEGVMALVMAVMAVPGAMGAAPVGWALLTLLTAATGHALWSLRRGAHHLHHLVGTAVMAGMAWTMVVGAGGGSMPAMPGGAMAGHTMGAAGDSGGVLAWATGALLLYYAGYVLVGGARLIAPPVPAGGAGGAGVLGAGAGPVVSRVRFGAGGEDGGAVPRACRLAMGLGMFAMLLTM